MNFLKEVLEHNKQFVLEQKKTGKLEEISKVPNSEVAILTCMDTRQIGRAHV